jgi:hypothetical protein
MLPDFNKIIEVFECMSLDNSAYFTFQSEENLKVCIQYEKQQSKNNWSVWIFGHERNSKKIISAQYLKKTLSSFKVIENEFVKELSNMLLFQAAYADEFIRQISDLLGANAVQKSILNTQNFMDELSHSVENIFHKNDKNNNKVTKKRLTVIK